MAPYSASRCAFTTRVVQLELPCCPTRVAEWYNSAWVYDLELCYLYAKLTRVRKESKVSNWGVSFTEI